MTSTPTPLRTPAGTPARGRAGPAGVVDNFGPALPVPAFGWGSGKTEYALRGMGRWPTTGVPFVVLATALGRPRAALDGLHPCPHPRPDPQPDPHPQPRPGRAERPDAVVVLAAKDRIQLGAAGPLVWPKAFTEGDKRHAAVHLAGLLADTQQTVLDEIDWMSCNDQIIRSPVAVVRTLATQARHGRFVPDGAHRIADGRHRALEMARRLPPPGHAGAVSSQAAIAVPALPTPTASPSSLPPGSPGPTYANAPPAKPQLSPAALAAIAKLRAWKAGRQSP